MYKEHPVTIKPSNENIKIWRFIDFTKYVSLLETSSLYFNRADLFEDLFEGTYPKPTVDSIRQQTDIPEFAKSLLIQSLGDRHDNLKKVHFLNCWHVNEYESDAMWKLYTNGNQSIAIQSTFNKLTKCFETELPIVSIGLVKYIDYNRHLFPLGNTFYPFFHKRISYQHEQELRALVMEFPKEFGADIYENITKKGIKVKINLDTLIENIYVAPRAPEWFKELVKSVTSKYSIHKPIESSSLDERPLFR